MAPSRIFQTSPRLKRSSGRASRAAPLGRGPLPGREAVADRAKRHGAERAAVEALAAPRALVVEHEHAALGDDQLKEVVPLEPARAERVVERLAVDPHLPAIDLDPLPLERD